MVSIGNVWDRTTAVMSGRAGILIAIAALLLFLPALVDSAIDIPADRGAVQQLVGGIASFVATIFSVWGSLALIAVASDPAVDRARAIAIAAPRILPAFGVTFVVGLAAVALAVPGIALIATAGFDPTRAQQNLDQVNLDAGRMGMGVVYFVVWGIAMLWLGARLVPLLAVVLNERRGIGAIRRSFALTRGSTWKLVATLLLFGIVLLVVVLASLSIVTVVVRLTAGPDSRIAIAIAVAVVSAAVTAGLSIVQSVFSAQFYMAARDRIDSAAPTL